MKVGTVLLGLWTAVLIGLSVRFAQKSATPEAALPATEAVASTDTRTVIALPVEARDAVLSEMRQMLTSVRGVLDGAVSGDTTAVRDAASKAGVIMAADPGLEKVLPKPFMQFGMTAHVAFDSLATNAGAGSAASIARLARITATCVECHAAYRIEVKQ